MPIKIFSHQADPDGLGCVVLSKHCFDEVDYTLCKNTQDLDDKLANFISTKEALKYEKIFITDLCPSIEILEKIKHNEELINKVLVIDHHSSNLEKVKDYNYSFVYINTLSCATKLFYDYLKKHWTLILPDKTLKEYVNLTDLHDTWKWKETNNLEAYHLETLLHKLGTIGYLNHFVDKLDFVSRHFKYTDEEEKWIREQLEEEQKYLDNLLKRVIYKKIGKINYGIVYGLYNYRNSLSDKLKDNKSCDVLIFIAVDNETISFRSITDIKVKSIAHDFNGGGHDKASSCSLNHENERKIIEKFLS